MTAAVRLGFPEPPGNLADRDPLIHTLDVGTVIHRFFNNDYPDPIFFDTSERGRFNSPDSSYGVCYAAENVKGAFAETFLRQPGHQNITNSELTERGYAELVISESIQLALVAGNGLARIGATAEITSSSPPYNIPHKWSAALHGHGAMLDGIAYFSRHDNSQLCYALFERCRHKFSGSLNEPGLDVDWVYDLVDHYGLGLLAF